jgi:ABC-2 type transport system permease protein
MTRSLAHMRWELSILLHNGEQLLLTLIIPLGLLVLVRSLVPVIATSVLAAMFTSLAIGTGFERRSGSLRFLGTTPLRRVELLAGKLLASLIILVFSLCLAVALAAILRCLPEWNAGAWLIAAVLVVLGSVAGAAWALFLAGSVRAEGVLAVANGVFIALVVTALALPGSLPSPWASLVMIVPSVALANGLVNPSLVPIVVLIAWAIAGVILASRRFTWDE